VCIVRDSNCWWRLWAVHVFTAAFCNVEFLVLFLYRHKVPSAIAALSFDSLHFITHTSYIDLMKALWLENSNMWQGEDSAMPRRCMWKAQTSGQSLKNTAFWLVNFYGVIYHPVGTAACITRRSQRRKWHANVFHSLL
jgi:hypothetical protein